MVKFRLSSYVAVVGNLPGVANTKRRSKERPAFHDIILERYSLARVLARCTSHDSDNAAKRDCC